MHSEHPTPHHPDHRDDDRVADPKASSFDKPGVGKDDDRVADPKASSFDKPGR